MFNVESFFKSFHGILPDPVTVFLVNGSSTCENDLSAIICFIPADRVENKLSICFTPIMQRLAVDDVARKLRDELWRKRVECFGIIAMREAVAFQRTGNAG